MYFPICYAGRPLISQLVHRLRIKLVSINYGFTELIPDVTTSHALSSAMPLSRVTVLAVSIIITSSLYAIVLRGENRLLL